MMFVGRINGTFEFDEILTILAPCIDSNYLYIICRYYCILFDMIFYNVVILDFAFNILQDIMS